MAMPAVKPEVDYKTLLDEAVRMGSRSVDQANRHMRVSRTAVEAIHDALLLMKCGRVEAARDRLERALVAVGRVLA